MAEGLQISARSVASLLTQILGPSIYDVPRFGGGDPFRRSLRRLDLSDLVSGPGDPEPWRALMLNPQPLPPRESYALALADAHVHESLSLDRVGALLGGVAMDRAVERAVRLIADVEELCPRWPRWPKSWPPPPPPPWAGEEMTVIELFVFGTRVLAAADLAEQEQLQTALTSLGEKALGLSLQG